MIALNSIVKKGIIGAVTAIAIFGVVSSIDMKPDFKDGLKEIMQDVYAPQSMEQFREGKKESLEILEQSVADRLFVAYGTELTELDKQRVCETYVYKGRAENQMDGKEKYLVKAFLYANKNSEPIKKNFIFTVGDSGKIEDFSITDMGGISIE